MLGVKNLLLTILWTISTYFNYAEISKTISIDASSKIPKNMKPTVNDLYSITSEHYINAGKEGLEHFNFLMNVIIEDVNNATLEELNAYNRCTTI